MVSCSRASPFDTDKTRASNLGTNRSCYKVDKKLTAMKVLRISHQDDEIIFRISLVKKMFELISLVRGAGE